MSDGPVRHGNASAAVPLGAGVEDEIEVRRRLPMKRLTLVVFLVILLVILAILWIRRTDLAGDYIARELERRGVQGSYRVTRIGFRTQRLENLVIGDPRRPDLTARWVEVDLGWGLPRPRIAMVRARGVRLFGRVAGGKLSLGQVDKLLPPPSGLPFRLPDLNVEVADSSLRLDTPAGRIGLALAGRGNLAGGFRGRISAMSLGLAVAGCRLDAPIARGAVAVDDLRPRFTGPVSLSSISCGDDFSVSQPRLALDARLAPGLDSWNGNTGIEAKSLGFGDTAMAGLSGTLGFAGNAADTRGRAAIAAASARVESFAAGRTGFEGAYAMSAKTGRFTLVADARAAGVHGGQSLLGPVRSALASTSGSPLGPIGASLSAAIGRMQSGFDVDGAIRVVNDGPEGAVRFEHMAATARSGAHFILSGGKGLTYNWSAGRVGVDGNVALSGGGFPSARFTLSQPRPGGPIRGVGRVDPMMAGWARLALGEIRFTGAPGGSTSIDTVATLDGPFSGGRVSGLTMPIHGNFGPGGFAFGSGCTTATFRTLQAGSLRLGPTLLPLCATGRAMVWKSGGGAVQGGASIRPLRLNGRLGGSALALTASAFRFGLALRDFTASSVALRLGEGTSVNRLDLATLSGRLNARGASGGFGGLSGKLASVALRVEEGRGDWRLVGDRLAMGGHLRVVDTTVPARILPLVSDNFRLTLADNRIEATAGLNDPETGTHVVDTRISHSLASGQGRALFDMPGLTFTENFQPEAITPLTTGVVALVRGALRGNGEIAWGPNGTTSSGTFATDDMDFAASFGPVEGLATTIHFDDLLGLTTAPNQLATTRLIRTGIDVLDGQLRYQLLPGLRVKVESGRWPFCGGWLILEETILDFSKPSAKMLTFRVEGLDAARFVQQMEFSNISATGTFDGTIPMIFDERGGRVVGGKLVARPEGGTLSYIGELTDKELGVYGKLAFDALKSMRYDRLIIDLNGSLEGEFIAGIKLDGVARDPSLVAGPAGGGIQGILARRAISQVARIPFKFNITVKGPFRTLIATTRSLEDPTNLIQSVLPDLLRNQPTTSTVQPQESENKP